MPNLYDYDAALNADVILPSQYFDSPRELTPEQRLALTVLQDGIVQAIQPESCTSARLIRLRDEAMQWVSSEDTRPFGFVWCCEVCGFNAGWLRRRILAGKIAVRYRHQVLSRASRPGMKAMPPAV